MSFQEEFTSYSAREAVQKGYALLDEHKPGWINLINWETLDLSGTYNCILGQLYGSYFRGCEALHLGSCTCCAEFEETGSDYGFNIPGDDFITFEMLEELWRTATGKI